MRLITSIAVVIFTLSINPIALGAPAAVPETVPQAPAATQPQIRISGDRARLSGRGITGVMRSGAEVAGGTAVLTETSCTGFDCAASNRPGVTRLDKTIAAVPVPIRDILALLGIALVGWSVVARR